MMYGCYKMQMVLAVPPMWTQLGRSKAVFIRKKPDNYRFTILELANQQDIAYGQPWKLVRFLASLAVALLQ